MGDADEQRDVVKPTERSGGATPNESEAREKGDWAAKAQDGVVPADLGGSDAPDELLAEEPELGDSVLGRTTGSDEPATETGVDLSAGDSADATSDGGAETPDAVQPDLKDASAGPRQVDVASDQSR